MEEQAPRFWYIREVMKRCKPPTRYGWGERSAPRVEWRDGCWLVVMSFQSEQEAEAFARDLSMNPNGTNGNGNGVK